MSADGFAGGLTDGTEEYAATDDREAQDVEAVADLFGEWLHRMHGVISSCDHHTEAHAFLASDWLAARERAAAEKALRDAAHALPGFIDGIHTHGDAARWLRERADRLGDA